MPAHPYTCDAKIVTILALLFVFGSLISFFLALHITKRSTAPTKNLIQVDSTESWKTYTNTANSYSFQYPADLSVKEDKQEIRFFREQQEFSPGITIESTSNEWLSNYMKDQYAQSRTYTTENGAEVTFAWGVPNIYEKDEYAVISAGDKKILFHAAPEEFIPILEKIFTTFQFTNSQKLGELDVKQFKAAMIRPSSGFTKYSFYYPKACEVSDVSDYRLHCHTSHGLTRIQIDVGGHGGSSEEVKILRDNEKKVYPSGVATIKLLETVADKQLFGSYGFARSDESPRITFDIYPTPIENQTEVEELMDQILSTFQFMQ